MPLLKLETTVVLSDDKRQALLASLSKTVAETIGKPQQYVMVVVSVNISNATLSVLDRRTGRLWNQRASRPEVAVTEARLESNEIDLGLRLVPSGLLLKKQIVIESTRPEFTFSLVGEGALSSPVR